MISVSGEFVVPLHGSIGRRSFGLFEELLQAFGVGAIFVFSLGEFLLSSKGRLEVGKSVGLAA